MLGYLSVLQLRFETVLWVSTAWKHPQCEFHKTAVDAYIDASSAEKNEVLTSKFTCPGQYLNGIWLHVPTFKSCFLLSCQFDTVPIPAVLNFQGDFRNHRNFAIIKCWKKKKLQSHNLNWKHLFHIILECNTCLEKKNH